MPPNQGPPPDPSSPRDTVLTVPNILSLARALCGPLVLALITTGQHGAMATALVLMIVAELSDLLDGALARRMGQETEFGRLIDPVCDSVYHLSVFLAFLVMGWMPAWMLFIIYARDLMVPYLRTFARQAGHDLQVRTSGRIKTVVHAAAQISIVAIALQMFGPSVSLSGSVPMQLLLLAIAASIYSLADYALEVSRLVRTEPQ